MEFFKETLLSLNITDDDGNVVEKKSIVMRPLKIKELPDLWRLLDIQEEIREAKEKNNDQEHNCLQIYYVNELLKTMQKTIDFDVNQIPQDAFKHFAEEFYDLNLNSNNKSPRKPKEDFYGKPIQEEANWLKHEDILVRHIDFLISEGHTWCDIQEYTLSQFSMLLDKAIDRRNGYKKAKSQKFMNNPQSLIKDAN